MTVDNAPNRRQFLRFLAGSPVVALTGLPALAGESVSSPADLPDPVNWRALLTQDLIKNPAEAINVFDFELAARKNVSAAHFGYMASGIDDELTLRANREAFGKFQLRPRRLTDVTRVETGTDLFGQRWSTPIVIAPTGGNRAYHQDGDLAVARAAKARGHLQILSTVASTSVEEVIQARGAPIWFQLYATRPALTASARGAVVRAQAGTKERRPARTKEKMGSDRGFGVSGSRPDGRPQGWPQSRDVLASAPNRPAGLFGLSRAGHQRAGAHETQLRWHRRVGLEHP